MKTRNGWSLFGILFVAAGIASCGNGDEPGGADEPAQADSAEAETPSAAASTDAACPAATDVAAAVGHPVESKPYGGGCYYETADFDATVTIMRIAPSQADQVEREMRESAAPYDAEITSIEVGDRGQAWGSPGYGQGYAVLGERAWIADVSLAAGGEDQRETVIQILEMMFD